MTAAVAATATATATAVAATTAATAIATAAATATGALFARTGFVDGQGATVKFFAIDLSNGFGGLFLGSHFDEREPTGLVGHLVQDEVAGGDIAGRFEEVQDVSLGGVERQVTDEQLCSHFTLPFVSLGEFSGDLFPTFGFQIVTGRSKAA
jgi:hypothetical protein